VRAALHLDNLTFHPASTDRTFQDVALGSSATARPASGAGNLLHIAKRGVAKGDPPSGVSHTRPHVSLGESDEALVERARSGDHRAFQLLFARYRRRAVRLASTIVHDYEDAQDVVQEAFLRVHRSLPAFVGHCSFYTWLYRIVMNLSIDFARRTQHDARWVEGGETWWLEGHGLPQSSRRPTDPLEALERRDLGRRLDAALDRLAPYHQGVLVMREVEGMSYQEMAVAMGVSKGTIMSRLFHARHNLRRAFGVRSEVGGAARTSPRLDAANDTI
jgi:RNA polymerase sigma-70 factor, ECF subfamily